MQNQKEGFTIHTFVETGTSVSELDNSYFAGTLVQLLPVLGIALVAEARWLISSGLWVSRSKRWQSLRLFLMLFALASIFITEIYILRYLERNESISDLSTLIHVTLTVTFVSLLWLPIEEISNAADLDGRQVL